ncbi:MAG: family 16 glycosylhydrolase [Bacilli bacterium]|nr:family 16 glycosylhydrolase [Bacilli bacterium]
MKKHGKTLLASIVMAAAAISAGCSRPSAPFESTPFKMGEKVISFTSKEEDGAVSWTSHGYGNGGMFLSKWSRDRVRYDNGIGYLSVADIDGVNYGAEIRTRQGYLYGYFGARIKTFKHSGTVQSVFTYNGGPNYIWDEIDIEILGKDTTKVQFNYYHEGVGGHEYMYNLGFDSSEDFHDYGFKWEESKITWYVDFKPVYAADASLGQWGNFFINVWASNSSVFGWTGAYSKTDTPLETAYDYMFYAPLA